MLQPSGTRLCARAGHHLRRRQTQSCHGTAQIHSSNINTSIPADVIEISPCKMQCKVRSLQMRVRDCTQDESRSGHCDITLKVINCCLVSIALPSTAAAMHTMRTTLPSWRQTAGHAGPEVQDPTLTQTHLVLVEEELALVVLLVRVRVLGGALAQCRKNRLHCVQRIW